MRKSIHVKNYLHFLGIFRFTANLLKMRRFLRIVLLDLKPFLILLMLLPSLEVQNPLVQYAPFAPWILKFQELKTYQKYSTPNLKKSFSK